MRIEVFMKALALWATAMCSAACTTTPRTELAFLDRYVGRVGSATLTLDRLRELPRTPQSGWLSVADPSVAIGRFQAVRRGSLRFELAPIFVTFASEKDDEHPAGQYSWHGDTLVICMLAMTPRTVKGSDDKLALHMDYDTCAPMQRVIE